MTDWLGIRVFEPEREGEEVVWHLRRNTLHVLKDVRSIGIHEGPAFVIKDTNRGARTYVCVHCRARFTQACSLQRHAKTCVQGKTVTKCPNERVEAPTTAYEKEVFPYNASQESLQWLEQETKSRKRTSITRCVGTEGRDIMRGFQWTGTTQKQKQYFNTPAPSGMVAQGVTQIVTE